MLSQLQIENIGIIEKLSVDFSQGLNVLTGETGAGKSIIISAFSLLLGRRVKQTEMLRKGAEEGKVRGLFQILDIHPAVSYLINSEIKVSDGEILITRIVNNKGKNKCLINGQIVTLSILKELGDLLVDIHGTHDHQKLLNTTTHIECVDRFSKLTKDLKKFSDEFYKWKQIKKNIDNIKHSIAEKKEKIEFFKFQINELSYLDSIKQTEEELEKEYTLLNESSKFKDIACKALEISRDSDASILTGLKTFKNYLSELSQIETTFQEQLEEIDSLTISISEAYHNISAFNDSIQPDEKKLNKMEELISQINNHKMKYTKTFKELKAYYISLKNEINTIDDNESLDNLVEECNAMDLKLKELSSGISSKRKHSAKKLQKELKTQLNDLGMEHAKIFIDISKKDISVQGKDQVEFLISTNPGESPKPLNKIVSGGELCRIMLAFKVITAAIDDIPILVFDEIDANIGGVTALSAAKKMKIISKDRQLITITHQPQIASKANSHFAVSKTQNNNITSTSIKQLSFDERVDEISRMLGGTDVTSVVREHAKEMIND